MVTFGCAKNLVDSEVMAGHLRSAGYVLVPDPARADVIILNTCGFIRPAREEAEKGIRRALKIKASRPGVRLVVTGCAVENDRPGLLERHPAVDAWLGVRDYDRIVAAAENRPFRSRARTFLYDHRSPRLLSTPPGWAYLKVSEGCSHQCAFCSIPSIKGPYRSRTVSSIIAEARFLEARGAREIVLVSQDTTAFGRDRGRADGLALLLAELLKGTAVPWIRFLYGYPEEITDALLEVMADSRICPYLDIPFQHASPAVLRRMKRASSAARILRLLEKIRKRLPEAAIRTSLIVGFPGEGPDEFKRLQEFVREARIDHLGVFTYCREEGTAAWALGDPVPEAEKERRRGILMEAQAAYSAENLRKFRGRTLDVLIEGPRPGRPGGWIGRTKFQAPEEDGVVFVRAEGARTWKSPLGRVKIISSGTYDLFGNIAS
ncbi:MAG TPA: 30S ribosomal protein S12 methylthiotransferase RimO [Candidatus Aminicenantes bacterium]|nr:30S ribosomal protein S12 methylthiotransferase RimO [Candidatus Aminicenantes bacterium]HOF82257.1 30S ribosomal protein S12 methylthiotransferase RimO [Candidatus Aminicenantes bacterium]